MFAFSDIRTKHDKLYKELFPSPAQQRKICDVDSPDRLMLSDGSGFDPAVRQRDSAGKLVSALSPEAAPQSEYLRTLDTEIQPMLPGLEQITRELPLDCTAVALEEVVQPQWPTANVRVAVKLGLLVQKRRRQEPQTSAAGLWWHIIRRTDAIYVVAEQLLPVFQVFLATAMRDAGLDPDAEGALLFGALKDPVRSHEKAVDDYAGRFDDGELPEACLLDVVRARAVCRDGTSMQRLLTLLTVMGGYVVNVDGVEARTVAVRCKNKFQAMDPTHFRNVLVTLELSHRGLRLFAEVQVHQEAILSFNGTSHAHDHYDYFRSLLEASYETGLNELLERVLLFLIEASVRCACRTLPRGACQTLPTYAMRPRLPRVDDLFPRSVRCGRVCR